MDTSTARDQTSNLPVNSRPAPPPEPHAAPHQRVELKWRRWFTVEGLDHGVKRLQGDSAVAFGQDVDPEGQQHAGSLRAQGVPHP